MLESLTICRCLLPFSLLLQNPSVRRFPIRPKAIRDADHRLDWLHGRGKTSIGSALAALLGWSFADLDQEIERQQDQPIREIFGMRGGPEFREIETKALQGCSNRCLARQ